MSLIDLKTGETELVWTKDAYPDNYDFQYGMTRFSLQLNYLSNHIKESLPHTDTRLRPDQRALEEGDFKKAAEEKHKLEEKQRAVRRYMEKNKLMHKTKYFEEWLNPDDPGTLYYKYNGLYFEQDRTSKDWSRLPDLYSEKLPSEVEANEKAKNKKK